MKYSFDFNELGKFSIVAGENKMGSVGISGVQDFTLFKEGKEVAKFSYPTLDGVPHNSYPKEKIRYESSISFPEKHETIAFPAFEKLSGRSLWHESKTGTITIFD